jgi:P-type Ca2+ transporter type 2C
MTDLADGESVPWHAVGPADAARRLDVEVEVGLSSGEVVRRRDRDGPNRLAEVPREGWWRAFLRQFQNLMIVVLLVAAAVSLVVTRQWETPVVIVAVVLLNAIVGFVQESRAGASLEALAKMLVTTASVRRDATMVNVDAAELVIGDVVTIEAGDRVPADGRLLSSTSLEVQESALTGEAQAVTKSATAQVDPGAALGDRTTTVLMSTTVTRGRGEIVVTATGMGTETGRVAHMLHEAEPEPTPLQRQITGLGRTLAMIAGAVIPVVFVLGLARGQNFGDLFISAVSLAVAAIPEGLPAVVTFTLAMGASRLARKGAVVKRLSSVETLGSTSQICTDKTGTLTLNQMTARVLLVDGHRYTVTGEGYSTDGLIRSTKGSALPRSCDRALIAMALCTDTELHDGDMVGDPTEGALLVLAAKGGVDVAGCRQKHPRLGEVPFDSEYKFMATFHHWTDNAGREVIRCFVKGAPDVLADRAHRTLDGPARERFEQDNAKLAAQGMRVLAIGTQDVTLHDLESAADPKDLLDQLVLIGMVGIVDPPRPEARHAIADCLAAGVRVRMITGDHALTAGAIADELGIPGETVTGSDLDRITSDDELAHRLDDIGVVARVSPAHKLRIVRALQARGDVVAMTGDGVNDAPALRQADIGVAMGVTGTEVTKEAATMVLTDDDFATIVHAVGEGRGIYDNIVKFIRFQLSTALGFVLTFLIASVTGIAGGVPFTAVQILFVNLVMDGPPAMSLGVDTVGEDAMNRPPRTPREHILNRSRLQRILLGSAVMAAGTLAVLVWAPGPEAALGVPSVAATMAFATFVFFQAFNLLNVRHETRTVFSRDTLSNTTAFLATGGVIVLLVGVVEIDALHGFFTTTDLALVQWLACAAIGSTILWFGELVKLVLGTRAARAAGSGSPLESPTTGMVDAHA